MEGKLAQLREQHQVALAVIEEMELELYSIPLTTEHEAQHKELQNHIDIKINEGTIVNSYIQHLKEQLAQHQLEQQHEKQVHQS
ncbi:hypothetical protein IWQ61_010699, partial [Dispira simplex]